MVVSYLSYLGLDFLIGEMGLIIVPTQGCLVRIKEIMCVEFLEQHQECAGRHRSVNYGSRVYTLNIQLVWKHLKNSEGLNSEVINNLITLNYSLEARAARYRTLYEPENKVPKRIICTYLGVNNNVLTKQVGIILHYAVDSRYLTGGVMTNAPSY